MIINKIYVLSPANFKTGGTELLHQFVKQLNDFKCPACIAYIGITADKDPINESFKVYTNNFFLYENIPDDVGSVVVAPEIYIDYLKRFEKAKRIIWWLSVDNFEVNSNIRGFFKHRGFLRTIKILLTGKIQNRISSIRYGEINLYQSEYARLYLLSLGYNNVLPVSDYVNDLFLQYDTRDERNDYVLYNPKKGYNYTKRIISRFPEFNWKPIENMSTEEVVSLLHQSKVYIDFGNHPGKDRFPREAAISGCCIITGMRGSAKNDIDVMIPHDYKFLDNNCSIPQIGERIRYCISNYKKATKDFEAYRDRIRKEKSVFVNEVQKLILYLKKM